MVAATRANWSSWQVWLQASTESGHGLELFCRAPRAQICRGCSILQCTRNCGLVAMTSASHAGGRQFDPGQVYSDIRNRVRPHIYIYIPIYLCVYIDDYMYIQVARVPKLIQTVESWEVGCGGKSEVVGWEAEGGREARGGRWEVGGGTWEAGGGESWEAGGGKWEAIGGRWKGGGRWEVGGARCEVGGRWEIGCGKWEVGGGRWEMGNGRWEVGGGCGGGTY